MTNILKGRLPSLRFLGEPPVSFEGEGSPIIWPISKENDTKKIVTIIVIWITSVLASCQRRTFWRDFDRAWHVLETDLS